MKKKIVTLVLAAVTAAALAFPQAALAQVLVDDQELAQGDNSVGGGIATLSDKLLEMKDVVAKNVRVDEDLDINFHGGNDIDDIYIEGSANVEMNFCGENHVEDTHVQDNANAVINANGHNDFEEVKASGNAQVAVNVTGENNFESIEASGNAGITVSGTSCQKRDIVNVGVDENDAGVFAENGNVTIDHVTVNLVSKTAVVGSKSGNVVINTSKIASGKGNEFVEIVAGGTVQIVESVIDIVGTVHSDGQMTVKHSDVKAIAPDSKYDASPYRLYSKTGVTLVNEKNGEVKEGLLNGEKIWFVDTGDGKDVDLKADGEPGYYACKDESSTRAVTPKTGDENNPWGLVVFAFAGAAAAGYAAKRRRDDAA